MRTNALTIAILFLTSVCIAGIPQETVFPQVSGWTLIAGETVYTPDNLWDVIDGAADLFLEYNFVDLHIGRYTNSSGTEIKVELYRHGSAEDAFGMYSQERYPDYHFIRIGVQGYAEKGILNFLSGQYYVKISTVDTGSDTEGVLRTIATAVEQHLRQPNSWPSVLAKFPTEGRIVNAEQYIAKNFLGYSIFHSAFVASYDHDGGLKAFVMNLKSEDESKGMIDAYLKSIPKEAISRRSAGEYLVQDPHNGPLYLGILGNRVFGVTGDGAEKSAQSLFNLVRTRLAAD